MSDAVGLEVRFGRADGRELAAVSRSLDERCIFLGADQRPRVARQHDNIEAGLLAEFLEDRDDGAAVEANWTDKRGPVTAAGSGRR